MKDKNKSEKKVKRTGADIVISVFLIIFVVGVFVYINPSVQLKAGVFFREKGLYYKAIDVLEELDEDSEVAAKELKIARYMFGAELLEEGKAADKEGDYDKAISKYENAKRYYNDSCGYEADISDCVENYKDAAECVAETETLIEKATASKEAAEAEEASEASTEEATEESSEASAEAVDESEAESDSSEAAE